MTKATPSEKIPPQNIEAEMSLLGAILTDENIIIDIIDKVKSEDFYDPRHQTIFNSMFALYEKRSPIDLLTLTDELKKKSELEKIGGKKYLAELARFVPNASNSKAYAEIIVENSARRRLIKLGTTISEMGFDSNNDIKEIMQTAESILYRVSEDKTPDLVSVNSILSGLFELINKLSENPDALRGIKTGFRALDKITNGLQESDLVVLAARPAMGKSTLAQNIAYNVATREKKAVLFFSLEMNKEQLVERMLSEATGIDNTNIRSGRLTGDDFAKISEAMGEMAEAPIYFDDTPGMTVLEMRTKARRQAHKTPLGLIIVDYLQLMQSAGKHEGNRVQEVSEISRGLKLMARELEVPVVAISQLSRSVESRKPQIPELSDLRESGSIEQDADIVMFMYREDYYDESTERRNITDIFIKKHRNGPIGRFELYFHPEQLKFMSLDKKAKNE